MTHESFSSNLLEYNDTYRVLICRKCQYAIQKSAVETHLLRHKIYRNDRRHLLSSIAHLDLEQPEDVSSPSPDAPPVQHLPVIEGLRCTVSDSCGNLCASEKRMRRHLAEVHGLSKELNNFSSLARPVTLQTFFRGTKLRYFEVNPSAAQRTQSGSSTRHSVALTRGANATSPPPPSFSGSFAPIDIHLGAMTYLHHFTIHTSFTLPVDTRAPSGTNYWQIEAVTQALQHEWLSCGILSIAASHLSILMDDVAVRKVHHLKATELRSRFTRGWNDVLSSTEEARVAATRVKHVLALVTLTSQADPSPSLRATDVTTRTFTTTAFSDISSILAEIRELFGSSKEQSQNRDAETFLTARTILNAQRSSETPSRQTHPFAPPSETTSSSTVFSRLDQLPYLLAEALGKPDNIGDVLTVMKGVADLVACANQSFASDDQSATWSGMAMWTDRISDQFYGMMRAQKPGALVVVAHWAVFLLGRSEIYGSWFIRGLGEAIRSKIMRQLAGAPQAVRDLVTILPS